MTGAAPGGTGGGSMMAAARALASEETQKITLGASAPTASGVRDSGDPLDVLVERVRPATATAVDPLQVAAGLEADGVTDRGARVQYGFDDVFDLADEVYRRVDPVPPPAAPGPPAGVARGPAWRSPSRDISHGFLYLLPGALFPAVLAAVGRGPLVAAIVLTGGLGWAWSGGASWLAYRRLGAGDPAGAAGALRWSVVLGLPAAAALGGAVTLTGSVQRPGVVGLCLAQMAYQLASTLLVFYRREGVLAATMAPAVVAGVAFVVFGRPVQPWALATGAAAVFAALVLGMREAARAAGEPASSTSLRAAQSRPGWLGLSVGAVRADLSGLAWVTAYAALSAVFLLHAQAPYLLGRLDIALAATPLLAGMGVVEWRVRRFGERGRALLRRARYPREFAVRIRLQLAAGVVISTGVVAVLAVPLLMGLREAGVLSGAGAVMAAAYAVLAGAYFLAFLLAEQGRYGTLCASLAGATAVHTVGTRLVGAQGDALVDTGVFLGSAVLLQVLWVVLLGRTAVQAWRYRS